MTKTKPAQKNSKHTVKILDKRIQVLKRQIEIAEDKLEWVIAERSQVYLSLTKREQDKYGEETSSHSYITW